MARRETKPERATVKAATGTARPEPDAGSICGGKGGGLSSHTPSEGSEQKELNESLMEQMLESTHMQAAYLAVKGNRGAPGVDHITTAQLGEHLRAHWAGIKTKLQNGSYRPSPVKAVSIAKPGGGERVLGIPTTQDRMIQQALKNVLEAHFDPEFSEHSYGFRPGRSAHDAVKSGQRAVVEEKRNFVIEIDIEGFFDEVDHDILMREIKRKVTEPAIIGLLWKYLHAPIKREDGTVVRPVKGTPQGGPLSPLLANIYLDQLDREMERRGLRFVRYADDITIYSRSLRSAERTYEGLVKWIEKNLKLKVNRTKSGIRPPEEGSFLGFRIEEGKIRISEKSLERFKARVREKWEARQSKTSEELRDQWKKYVRGWWSYYRLTECRWDYEALSKWIRRHIRKCFWQRWHNHKGRRNALRRLGLPEYQVCLGSCSRGAWRMAGHAVMQRALNNRVLLRYGFETPLDLAKDN